MIGSIGLLSDKSLFSQAVTEQYINMKINNVMNI